MGIFTDRDKGGFNIIIKHGQDHNHVMSHLAEVVQSDYEGSRKQDGMDLPKATTPGSRSHSMAVDLNQGRSQGSRAGLSREYCKVGAAVATALCGSLRGSEVFILELAAL